MSPRKHEPLPPLVDVDAPDGFDIVTGADIDGYFAREPGATCRGYLINSRKYIDESDGEERETYHMELTEACSSAVVRGPDKTWVPEELQPSQIMGIDATGALKALSKYVGTGHEVFIAARGKIKKANGHTPWQYTMGVRKVTPPTRHTDEPSSSNEVPF